MRSLFTARETFWKLGRPFQFVRSYKPKIWWPCRRTCIVHHCVAISLYPLIFSTRKTFSSPGKARDQLSTKYNTLEEPSVPKSSTLFLREWTLNIPQYSCIVWEWSTLRAKTRVSYTYNCNILIKLYCKGSFWFFIEMLFNELEDF